MDSVSYLNKSRTVSDHRSSVDVRDRHSIWETRSPALRLKRLSQNIKCEVLVIGAGISGAIICHELMSQGITPTLVDRGNPAQGSTAASTAIITYELDSHLVDLAQKLGNEAAQNIYRTSYNAMNRLVQRIGSLSLPASVKKLPSLYVARTKSEATQLEREYVARKQLGIDCRMLSSQEIRLRHHFIAAAALRSESIFLIDPVETTRALITNCMEQGMPAYGDAAVIEVKESENGVEVQLEQGHVLSAQSVIFATGYETSTWLGSTNSQLITSYVAVTEPIDASRIWGEELVLWECSRPYSYIRPTFDGRLMIGGGDKSVRWPWLRTVLAPWSFHTLKKSLQQYAPRVQTSFQQKWWGLFGESPDGLPTLGILPKNKRVFCVYACGGNGILFSEIASQMVIDWMQGRTHPLAAILKAGRE